MSSFLSKTPASNTLLISEIFDAFLPLKITLLVIIIYVSTSGGKNGLFSRVKKFKRLLELVNKYPGVNFYPLLGSTPEMAHLVIQPCRDFPPWMQKMAQNCGPIFRFWIFNQPKLVITCPDTAIASLKDEIFPDRTSEALEVGRAVGGEGLLVLSPDIHGPRKKMWKQWFTRSTVNGNLEMFQKEASRLSKVLSMETNKTFNFVDYALHCTFRTIASSTFGEDYVNCISETAAKQHFHGLTTMSINMFTRVFRPWLANDFIYYNFTADGRQTRRCVKTANKLVHDAIKHAKILRTKNIKQMDATGNTTCFLDHLMDIHEQGDLSEKQIFNELNNFLVAGYDTTGLSISWTLYLLALHPECQTKIVDELCNIFNGNIKDFSSQVTPMHLQNMRYLELCIKESLRFYPAFALIMRRSATDKEVVMSDGNIIPSGLDMYIPLRIVHQNPKYFHEPEKFLPERHLVQIPAYLPFGLGSRNCIGQVYAIQEMKIILAYLLMEYKWETPEKPNMEPLMVPLSYPENGIRFKISKRAQ